MPSQWFSLSGLLLACFSTVHCALGYTVLGEGERCDSAGLLNVLVPEHCKEYADARGLGFYAATFNVGVYGCQIYTAGIGQGQLIVFSNHGSVNEFGDGGAQYQSVCVSSTATATAITTSATSVTTASTTSTSESTTMSTTATAAVNGQRSDHRHTTANNTTTTKMTEVATSTSTSPLHHLGAGDAPEPLGAGDAVSAASGLLVLLAALMLLLVFFLCPLAWKVYRRSGKRVDPVLPVAQPQLVLRQQAVRMDSILPVAEPQLVW